MTRDELVPVHVDRPRSVSRRVLSPAAVRMLPFLATMAVLLMGAFARAPATGVHAAPAYTVIAMTDEDDAGACGSAITSGAGSDGLLSLREAICEANNAGGAQTISVTAGTYLLGSVGTGELRVGSASGAAITITGAGAASTIIHQTIANQRVFNLDFNGAGNVTVNISQVTISGGTGTTFGGGGILAGGTNDNTTLDQDSITGNTTSGGNQGGGIGYGGGGNLTITNSTISTNTSDLLGGGIAFNQTGNSGNLTISNSIIAGNTVTNASGGVGGGLSVTGNNTIAITSSTFTTNTLSGGAATDQHGGAIEIEGGTLNLSVSRIVGNTAGNGTGLYVAGGATAHATNNWWGCNGGPGSAGCDDTQGPGTINTNPYLKLTLTADSTQLNPNSSTGLHARTTINSNGVDTSGAGHLPDSPTTPNVTFAGTLGTVSPSSVALTAGLAGSTYTADGTSGNGSASATLDNATATANITVPTNTPTATSTNTPTSTPTGTPDPTATPTSTPTGTVVVPIATATQTPTGTPDPTATPTSTSTGTVVAPTSTAASTPTGTTVPTASPESTTTTPTNTATATPITTRTNTPTATPTRTATNMPTTTRTRTPTSTGTSTPRAVATATRTPRPDVLITVQLHRQGRPHRPSAPALSYHITVLSHPMRRHPLFGVRILAAPRRRVLVTLDVVRILSRPADPRHRTTARRTRAVYRTTARGLTNGQGRLYLTLHSVYLSSGHATGRVTITIQGFRAITVHLKL